MAYFVPSLQISQEFTQLSTAVASPLAALIIGPDLRKGEITAIGTGTGGSNYTTPAVTITDTAGTGSGAVVTATCIPLGAITAVAAGSPGSLYTQVPTVTITDATGSGAIITAVLGTGGTAGEVVSFTVTANGSGYTAPTFGIVRGAGDTTGTGATAGSPTLAPGTITGYVIVNGGSEYTTPVVTVSDTGIGSGAVPGSVTLTGSYTLNTSLSGTIGSVSSVADIVTQFGSATDINNPLAYGLYNAVQNASGTTVYFGAVPTNDLSGYNSVLALAQKSNLYYGIVPMTNDHYISGISNALVSHVNAESDPTQAKWRTCWLTPYFDGTVSDYIGSLLSGVQNANANSGPRRIHNVFPDTYYADPVNQVGGWFLAAGLAGLRAGSAPHQSLTNTQVIGPYYLDKVVSTLTVAQLNQLAAAGVWIVDQAAKGGAAYTRQQLTGDSSGNLNYQEDSVTANVDSISYALQAALAPFIGIYNVTPANLLKIRAVIDSELSFYLTSTYTVRAGNQLLGYTINSVAQNATLPDRVDCSITLQVPYPMNFITISITI